MDASAQAFRWTEQYSVHIDELDRQHQWLFATINELNEALSSGQGAAVTHSVLQKLVQYALTHFAAEEKLMEQHSFPGLQRHKTEHHKFAEDLAKFEADFDNKKSGVPVALLFFLDHWLKHHILTTDKEYSSYLNEHGVR